MFFWFPSKDNGLPIRVAIKFHWKQFRSYMQKTYFPENGKFAGE